MPSRRDGFVDQLPGSLHLSQRRIIRRGVSRRQTEWAGDTPYRHHGEYIGEFRDGWPSGRGAYAYPDGRRYVGEWRNGDFNGREVRTYPDGRKEDGEWSGGEFIKDAQENSPLSDTSKKPPAAIVDASEINQSRPVVLTGNEIFGGVVPLLMVFLVFGAVIAAVFGLKAAAHQLPSEVELTKPTSDRKLTRLGARYSKPSRITVFPMPSCWSCAQAQGGFRGTREPGKRCGN